MHNSKSENNQWSDGPVPRQFCGLWDRLSIEFADEAAGDRTTRVLWLQSENLYVDIRQPAGRPDFAGVGGFADVNPAQARYLAAQEGFAGKLCHRLRAGADELFWQRWMDFSPPDGPLDQGRMRASSPKVMVEEGLHAPYTEHWWLVHALPNSLPNSLPESLKGQVQSHWNGSNTLYVAFAGHFMLMQDRRPAMPPPGQLARLVESVLGAGKNAPNGLKDLLDCEISYGLIQPNGSAVIHHSTLPWREGEMVDFDALKG